MNSINLHKRKLLAALYGYLFLSAILERVFGLGTLRHVAETGAFCPFHFFTGLQCPGCGMTRAFFALAKLDWIPAWSFNPLSFLLFALGLAYLVLRKNFLLYLPSRVQAALLVVVVLFGVIRNQ